MWSDDDGPYEGTHYRLAETLNVPQSLQRPHPPVMIGGGGERKLLRLVAKYANANNLFPASPELIPAQARRPRTPLRRRRPRPLGDPQHHDQPHLPRHRHRRVRRGHGPVRSPRLRARTARPPRHRTRTTRRAHRHKDRAAPRRALASRAAVAGGTRRAAVAEACALCGGGEEPFALADVPRRADRAPKR